MPFSVFSGYRKYGKKKKKKNIIAYQGATYIWCLAVDGTRTGCLATVDWMDNYIPTENNKCDYLDSFGT